MIAPVLPVNEIEAAFAAAKTARAELPFADRIAYDARMRWFAGAHPHQIEPEGDWRTWLLLAGRGAGKTRAGAEWVRAEVEGASPLDPGRAKRVALLERQGVALP